MKLKYFFFLFILLNSFFTNAQKIVHLGYENGLTGQRTFKVTQDKKGFIWISNRFGACRYDGNKIKYYNLPLLKDFYPVRAFNIISDNQGSIWVYTNNGDIYKYSEQSDSFENYKKLNYYLPTVSFDENNDIWFGTRDFIGCIKKDNIETIDHTLLKDLIVKAIIQYGNQNKIIITDKAILNLDLQTKQIRNLLNPEDQKLFNGAVIESAYFDRQKKEIWIGTNTNGIWIYSINRSSLQQITKQSENFPPVTSILTLNDSVMIVSTDGAGIFLVDKESHERLKNYRKDESNSSFSLSSDAVYDIFKDNENRIWLATSGGIDVIDFSLQGFKITKHQPDNINSPILNNITCMIEDSNHNQWFGTNNGLSLKNTKTNQWSHFLRSNFIQTLFEDSKKQIWVGTYGSGVYLLNAQHQIIKHITSTKGGLSSNLIYTIIEDSKKNIWFGGRKGKMCKYNPEKNSYSTLPINQINKFAIKDNNTLLVGTEGGFYKVNINTDQIYEYNSNDSTSSRCICDFYIESDSIIWLATYGSGLIRFNTSNNKLRYITNEKGIVPNICYKILPDNENNIWVTSENKINKINLADFSIESFSNGYLPFATYTHSSGMKTSNGELFFGSNNGYISFNPDLIKQRKTKIKLVFLNFSLFNKVIHPDNSTSPLKDILDNSKTITLNHNQHSFSINFTAIDLSLSNKCRYIWKLEGFDESWTEASYDDVAFYTNLSPKKYIFHVKAIGNNQEILDERKVSIIIKPPFYNTWLAYLFYIITISALVYWFSKQAKARYYLQTSLDFEKKEKEKNEELTQSKLRFFTNISHEIRTPVTMIIGQTESLLYSKNIHPSVYSKVVNIHKNASNLSGLVNELLDFRKQEQGHLKLKITEINFVDFLKETYLTFKEYAINKDISLLLSYSSDEIKLWIDIEQMQKVINNLLSNAFKFTPKGGKISISIEENQDEAIFAITDNGQGILPDKIDYIFDRFYQADQSDNIPGTGIGLALAKGIIKLHHGIIKVESEVNNGAAFLVILKKGDSHFPEDVERAKSAVEIYDYESNLPVFTEELQDQNEFHDKKLNKLLIVEDNSDLRNFLAETFKFTYVVETANDGLDGLEKVRNFMPDIVISDIMMPRMSGIELCSKIKNNFDTCHIPVVLLTAKTALEHKFEGLRIGADDYISKPFNVRMLVLRCNNIVNSRKLLQSKYIHQPDLSHQQQIATTAIDQKFIEKATAFVENNLDNSDFGLKTLAIEMGLSRSSLFNKLKGITGVTPNSFISNIRLKKAAEMLINNNELNISDIAYTLGFSSPRYFNKCFKDLFGYAPAEYRKINRKS